MKIARMCSGVLPWRASHAAVHVDSGIVQGDRLAHSVIHGCLDTGPRLPDVFGRTA